MPPDQPPRSLPPAAPKFTGTSYCFPEGEGEGADAGADPAAGEERGLLELWGLRPPPPPPPPDLDPDPDPSPPFFLSQKGMAAAAAAAAAGRGGGRRPGVQNRKYYDVLFFSIV